MIWLCFRRAFLASGERATETWVGRVSSLLATRRGSISRSARSANITTCFRLQSCAIAAESTTGARGNRWQFQSLCRWHLPRPHELRRPCCCGCCSEKASASHCSTGRHELWRRVRVPGRIPQRILGTWVLVHPLSIFSSGTEPLPFRDLIKSPSGDEPKKKMDEKKKTIERQREESMEKKERKKHIRFVFIY